LIREQYVWHKLLHVCALIHLHFDTYVLIESSLDSSAQ